MARLRVLSGLGGKLPAAFLLELAGTRILFDLGEGPEPGVFPDVRGVTVDALCLSHAHIDHVGALHLWPEIGCPDVYATAAVWAELSDCPVPPSHRRVLPEQGQALVADVPFLLGRSGHALGGVWFHTDAAGGFLYMGDWSVESALLPFDPPPPAATVITDASYAARDQSLKDQIAAIADAARAGAVLCVPEAGRGPEMALTLARLGLPVRVCPRLAQELGTLPFAPEPLPAIAALPAGGWQPQDTIIAIGPNADYGLPAELLERGGFRFVFSGHVPDQTPAARLLADGSATWLPWNVHPRRQDTIRLAQQTGARRLLLAFTPAETAAPLTADLAHCVTWETTLDLC